MKHCYIVSAWIIVITLYGRECLGISTVLVVDNGQVAMLGLSGTRV